MLLNSSDGNWNWYNIAGKTSCHSANKGLKRIHNTYPRYLSASRYIRYGLEMKTKVMCKNVRYGDIKTYTIRKIEE